jgi:hypothetical protein
MATKLKAGISIWRSGERLFIGNPFKHYLLPEKIGEKLFIQVLNRLISNSLETEDQPIIEALTRLNLIDKQITEISYRYRADRFSLSSIDGTRNLALQQFLERFEIESDSAAHQVGDIDGGRSKLNLFAALKAAGFESTSLQLPGESVIGDLSGTQMQKCELGLNRSDLIKRIDRDASLYPEPIDPPSRFTFAISIGTPSPDIQHRWLNNGISHLLLNFAQDSVRVGPIVIAGKTPCANCLSLSEIETGAIPENGNYIFRSPHRETGSALANLAATIAALEVMRFADSGTSELIGKSALYKGTEFIAPHITNWQFQPRCGCRNLPSTRATPA